MSEFDGSLENSTQGRMGEIREKPAIEELFKITEDIERLASARDDVKRTLHSTKLY